MYNDPHRIDSLGIEPTLWKDETNIFTFHYPIVLFLKLLGICPVYIISPSVDHHRPNKCVYKFNWKSGWFLYSSTVIFLVGGLWFIFALDKILLVPIPIEIFVNKLDNLTTAVNLLSINTTSSTKGIMHTVQKTLGVTFPISIIVHACNILRTTPTLVQYLNNWTSFEESIKTVYPSRNNVFKALFKFRKNLLIVTGAGLALVSVILVPILGIIIQSSAVVSYKPLSFIMAVYGVTIVMIGNDLKSVIMLKTCDEAFKQIKEIVGNHKGCILLSDVRTWIKLTEAVRNQINLSSRIQEIHLFVDMVGLFVIWCGTAFGFIYQIQQKGFESIFTASSSGSIFLVVILTRLTSKTYLIEDMRMQEQMIAEELRAVNFGSDDISVVLETKMLIDLIATTPSKVSILNLVVFNRKLLFKILGQVASYLFVLLQFQTNSKDA